MTKSESAKLKTHVRINGLHVRNRRLYSQHVLVQTSSKVSIKKEPINDSFSYNTAHESEVSLIIGIDVTVWIGLECAAIFRGHEQCVVGIEHLLGQNGKEFS